MEGDENVINASNICLNVTGVVCAGTGSKSVRGCLIGNNDTDGINLSGNNSLIEGNQIKNNGGIGIYVTGDDNNIGRNRIWGSGGNGLEVAATALDTIVSSNNLKGNTGINFIDNGTATDSVNNKV